MLSFVLGCLFIIFLVIIFLLLGACMSLRAQVKKASEELFTTKITLGRCTQLEQERQRLREAVNVNFTEEQITTIANRINARVKLILDTEQQAALSKLS